MPALRERRSDIPDLARQLLARAARRPMDQVADLLGLDAIAALDGPHETPVVITNRDEFTRALAEAAA